jgi:protein involved in polysaccharide export with SLBB domain
MMNKSLSRWLAPLCLAAASFLTAVRAQDAAPAAAAPPPAGMLSVTSPAQRAAWQDHLTLGPGDTLDFSLFLNDAPDQIRNDVVIGPDGRISYLQAQDIMAAGLTVDELRAKMDDELSKYYRSPKTIITPVAIVSKKYYVLGAVVTRGVYPLDRPLTVIEALGRAGGLATGVFERNTVEYADLSHSFMVRDGRKIPVDFEKLFQQGDLSQNIPLAPGDYLYFASSGANAIYVIGSVGGPGPLPFSAGIGAVAAISSRGGFGPKAYKAHVLVIRGSLNHPQTFVVNSHEILDGKKPDFLLQPKDIVYVANRPWALAEEALDDATTAFIQSFIVTYTGDKVGPFINPLVH